MKLFGQLLAKWMACCARPTNYTSFLANRLCLSSIFKNIFCPTSRFANASLIVLYHCVHDSNHAFHINPLISRSILCISLASRKEQSYPRHLKRCALCGQKSASGKNSRRSCKNYFIYIYIYIYT